MFTVCEYNMCFRVTKSGKKNVLKFDFHNKRKDKMHFIINTGEAKKVGTGQPFQLLKTKKMPRSAILLLLVISVADSGCLFRIPAPNFSIPDPGSKSFRFPDPHENLSILTQQIALGNMIQDVHPRIPDPIRILIFYHPGSRGQKRYRIPDPQHCW
jgi:hypothetical protein